MLYYILAFLSFLQSVIGFTLVTSSVMIFKEPIIKRVFIGLSVMFIGIVILSYLLYTREIQILESIAIIFILLIEVSWFLICSADRFFISLFNFLTFVNVYVAIGFIGDTFTFYLDGNIFLIMLIVIRLSMFAITSFLIYKFVRPSFRNLVNTLDKEWRIAFLVPLMFLILQITVLYYPEAYWHWEVFSWMRIRVMALYLLFITVYYLLYAQAQEILEKYSLEKRQLLIAQQEKLWESELNRQKATMVLASKQRHDLHHHNTVIKGLLENNEISKLKEYLNSYDSSVDVKNNYVYCSNTIANSIFNNYANKAQNENIKINFDVNIPESINIKNIDLTCILGNALENAFEACIRIPKNEIREINVKAIYLDNRLRVRVENTCEKDIQFDGEFPITKKIGGGTGTRSIVYTAELYDGTAGFSVMDGKFVAQIVLNER